MHRMDPMATCPFVHQTLQDLRREVGNQATVLGFVGLPYTLATYLVEGQSSKVSSEGSSSTSSSSLCSVAGGAVRFIISMLLLH